MGKGSRNREKNAGRKDIIREKEAVQVKKQNRNKLYAGIVAAVLLVTLIATTAIYMFYYNNGTYLRNSVVMETENFQVSNATMSYFFDSSYVGIQNQYGDYFTMLTGIDPSVSLKMQEYSEGATWFDYVLSSTVSSVSTILSLAEEAKAEGVELTEQELQAIEDDLANVDPYFLQDGVSVDDIRQARLISDLAIKYETLYLSGLEYSDEMIESHYEENMFSYQTVSYYSYVLDYSAEQEDGVVPYTQEQAEEKSKELTAVSTPDEFLDLVEGMIKEQNPEITDENLQAELDSVLVAEGNYSEQDTFYEWAFEEGREVGETFEKVDEVAETYTVYYLSSLPARNEETTLNIRHILLTPTTYGDDLDAKVQEVMDAYNADPTIENFESLVTEYTEDGGSKLTGGLYENVSQGEMVAEFDAWMFDSSREIGDFEAVETDFGTHIMLFDGEGTQVWEKLVIETMESTDYQEMITRVNETHSVTIDEEKMQDIPA